MWELRTSTTPIRTLFTRPDDFILRLPETFTPAENYWTDLVTVFSPPSSVYLRSKKELRHQF